MNEVLKLFVPGRLCILGEHSDWAGLYRVINSSIVPGHAIVAGINQGIYAEITRSEKFIVDSTVEEFMDFSFVCDMNSEALMETARKGEFFSYVAGVAAYINDNFQVGGIHITITRMDLPIKSGLSSSAAICVLVTRAFNRIYKLGLDTGDEADIAFKGEQRTPSRCGRIDQVCAYGQKLVDISFNGNEYKVNQIELKNPLYFVIADLKAEKDTVKILADLHKCFPFAENDKESRVHTALGEDNERFVQAALESLSLGDNNRLGQVMIDFQENFDKKVAPASPQQLESPVLHSLLNDPMVKSMTLGRKGVGSQGDGTAQFLVADSITQEKLSGYIESKYSMKTFKLTLNSQKSVTKAIIPVAGFGTRLYPATKVLKKDFFPIKDKDGLFKPAIMILLEQLIASGIEQICLVIGEGEKPLYDNLFTPLCKEYRSKLSEEKQRYDDLLSFIGSKITYVYQKERKGFGHAVYQCRDFTKGEPVMLLLGDMIYTSFEDRTCMKQLMDVYAQEGKSVISMHEVPKEDVIHYGIMQGNWQDSAESIMKLDAIVEKPAVDYAKNHLAVRRKDTADHYYAVFGQYILTKEVFECLEEDIVNNNVTNGEIQLTTALERVRERYGMAGSLINGKSYDIGLADKYIETVYNF